MQLSGVRRGFLLAGKAQQGGHSLDEAAVALLGALGRLGVDLLQVADDKVSGRVQRVQVQAVEPHTARPHLR